METATTPTFEADQRGIGWIAFDDDRRKLNVLTEAVMRRLAESVEEAAEAAASGRIKVLVIRSGKPDSFLAGADIEAIAAVEDPVEAEAKVREGQAVYARVAALSIPVVAAIHGVCVGGGTELALACSHRVLSDSRRTRVGLPEVQLGILPAWGGTTRLPRLVGLQAALNMLLTGRLVDARKARGMGFADEVLPAELFVDKVTAYALRVASGKTAPERPRRGALTRLMEGTRWGQRVVLAAAKKRVRDKTGGHYPAPLAILALLRRHLNGPVEAGLDAEARAAAALLVSPECKNLLHVFRLREATKKGPSFQGGTVQAAPVTSLAILGAGVMGGGIAHLAASRGVSVRMRDVRHEAITSGLRHARRLFDETVQRGRLSRLEAAGRMEMISGGLDWSGFAAADVVVEAVVEDMEIKRAVLQEAETRVSDGCVIATNTSSLSVSALSEGLRDPGRFCGMHFFNPVHRMPLVEIVRGVHTTDETVARVYALALALDKVPVVVGDGPGFVVNRILGPYLNEAGYLLGDGAAVKEIDAAARAFGMPMGPLRLMDEVGIDISSHVGATFYETLGERLSPAPALRALAESGRLGRKAGRGFYLYRKGREKGVDDTVYADLGAAVPATRGGVDRQRIRRRLVGQMINEAARLLEEGVATSAADVDIAMIMGTGFPPFRGGLLRFADSLHPRGALDRIRALHDQYGSRFAPAPLLEELARTNRLFYEAFAA
ncbi:MAG: enoyl-CoA hydratase/isomerase family protein [Gemmatimonadetes bacterium]|nr:enoyl-CoA hydratase/isomerase family protein [Gemmatimonadota bacterium]